MHLTAYILTIIFLTTGAVATKRLAVKSSVQGKAELEQYALDLDYLPHNVALYAGLNVTLTCWVSEGTTNPRVQWIEYATNSNGALISDGDNLTPAHPNFARYTLIRSESSRQFDLHIRDVSMADGGVYLCIDTSAIIGEKQRAAAQLIVIDGYQNCSTSIPMDAIVLEGWQYTAECITYYGGMIAPTMRWIGPGSFEQGSSTGPDFVFSLMRFTAEKGMIGSSFESYINFTDSFLPAPADMAENIPDFEERFHTVPLNVHWPPQDMYADPVKPLNEYEVGDSLECFADANPPASYEWHNTRTGDRYSSKTFTIPPEWSGTNQYMRCIATNFIYNQPNAAELLIVVNVVEPTLSPTTISTPPPTTPPAVSNCNDLTGHWESNNPSLAHACIEVDELGNVHGVLRTGYDTFWYDLVGQTNTPYFDHTSWTAIWPLNRAVTTFIGECYRCYGEEIILVSAVSRSKGGPPCGTPGAITYTEQYEFRRSRGLSCPPITIPI